MMIILLSSKQLNILKNGHEIKKNPDAGQIYEENREKYQIMDDPTTLLKLKEKTRKVQRAWTVQVQRTGEG